MSSITECCTPCSTVPPVNVPGVEGAAGQDGTDGANGVNSHTITTADFEVPLVGANVTVDVGNSTWMTPGQNIFVQGAGYFVVVSKPTSTTVILTYLDYEGNTNTGNTISAGAGVSPAGTQGPSETLLPAISDYALAGSQALTDTDTNPDIQLLGLSITLATAGTYLIFATVRIDFSVATFSTDEIVTLKLRETTNGPADVTNAVVHLSTGVTSVETSTFGAVAIPAVTYLAAAGATIQVQGTVSDTPYSGSIIAVEGSLTAIKLF